MNRDDEIEIYSVARKRRLPEAERDLGEGVVRAGFGRAECSGYLGEGGIGVGRRIDELCRGGADEVRERLTAVGAGAQNNRLAAAGGHCDRDVVRGCETRKKNGHSGFEHDERGGRAVVGESAHGIPRCGPQGDLVRRANMPDARRPGAVGRQREQVRRIGQSIDPVGYVRRGATAAATFEGAVRMNLQDGHVRAGGDEFGDHVDETGVMRRQVVVVVAVGVCPEIDECSCRSATLVNVDEEVLDRAGRDDVEFADDRAELNLLMEQHHVDHRAGELFVASRGCQLAPDIFDAEPLVPQRTHQLELYLLYEFTDGGLLGDAHRNGCDVDQHSAGSTEEGRGARGHGDVDQDVFSPGHAREVTAECSDEHRGGGPTLRRVRRFEFGDDVIGQCDTAQLAGRDGTTGCVGQRGTVVDARSPRCPVLLVRLETSGRPVLLIEVVQSPKFGCLVRLGFDILDRCGVERGGALDQCHGTVAVEGDVVDLAVPEVAFVLDLKDPAVDERIVLHVDRLDVVLVYPRQRRRHRIVFAAKIQVVHRLIYAVVDRLNRLPVDLGQAQVGRLELVPGAGRRLLENRYVEWSAQIDVLGDTDSDVRRELLRKPHSALRRGQREGIVEPCSGRRDLRATGGHCAHSLAFRRDGGTGKSRRRTRGIGAFGRVRDLRPRRRLRAIEQFWRPFWSAFVSVHTHSMAVVGLFGFVAWSLSD
ncbi:hypothetical protein RN2511_001160 [Rhodococcus sp. NKCM2511]|nr:hypothetical protein RN2511_001160 [Rhodococcus sp. NKCM2511]